MKKSYGPRDPIRAAIIIWAYDQMHLTFQQIAELPSIQCTKTNVYLQYRRWYGFSNGNGMNASDIWGNWNDTRGT